MRDDPARDEKVDQFWRTVAAMVLCLVFFGLGALSIVVGFGLRGDDCELFAHCSDVRGNSVRWPWFVGGGVLMTLALVCLYVAGGPGPARREEQRRRWGSASRP